MVIADGLKPGLLLRGSVEVGVRVGGEARHAWQAAEVELPPGPVEGEGGVAGGRHPHLADRVGDDGAGSFVDAHVVDVDGLADVTQLHRSDVRDDRSKVASGDGGAGGDEQLSAAGLASDAGGEVDGGAVVVAVDDHGRSVVGAGAWKQYGVVYDELPLQQCSEGGDRGLRCRELQHDGVADRLDQLVVGAEYLQGAVAERPYDGHSFGVSVRFGHRREPGEVDEREGCLHCVVARRGVHRCGFDSGGRGGGAGSSTSMQPGVRRGRRGPAVAGADAEPEHVEVRPDVRPRPSWLRRWVRSRSRHAPVCTPASHAPRAARRSAFSPWAMAVGTWRVLRGCRVPTMSVVAMAVCSLWCGQSAGGLEVAEEAVGDDQDAGQRHRGGGDALQLDHHSLEL